jgi:Arc/MetJ family transcription regulator
MRTNVVIDPDLLKTAQKATGLKTKRAVIEEALRRLVRYHEQAKAVRELKGLADWEGDLERMREDRSPVQW